MGDIMKNFMKSIFFLSSLIIAVPFLIYYHIEVCFIGKEKSFQGLSQFFSLFPGLIGAYLRRGFYILTLDKCAWDCHIGFGTIFSHPALEIGRHVYIGTNCTIGRVSLGDYVTIGSNVDIISGAKQHCFDNVNIPIQEQGGEYSKICVGEDVWIGNSSVIMANIGKKSIIGAGSVVVNETEEYSIAAGNPARVIKKRLPNSQEKT